MPSNHLVHCCPFIFLPSIFPSLGVFSKESGLRIMWPNMGVSSSASVLQMNIQDWFPLGLTGLISLLSKGLSRIFSDATVQKHQFGTLALSFLYSLNLTSIKSVMKSNHLILCLPLSSCLQSFPPSGFFQMSQFFASGGQSIGVSASASVLPMNIQNWFPLGLTGLISLQSKGLSRAFSYTTVQKHKFFSAQLSL